MAPVQEDFKISDDRKQQTITSFLAEANKACAFSSRPRAPHNALEFPPLSRFLLSCPVPPGAPDDVKPLFGGTQRQFIRLQQGLAVGFPVEVLDNSLAAAFAQLVS